MPYEKPSDARFIEEFCNTLDVIGRIIESHDDIDHVVFGGDLNSDLKRTQSHHINPLRALAQRCSLLFCVEHRVNSVDFAYKGDVTGSEHTLDHFLVTHNLSNMVEGCTSVHDVDSFSDHCPVLLTLNVGFRYNPETVPGSRFSPKLSWARANDEHKERYRALIQESLAEIELDVDALSCSEINCVRPDHVQQCSNYFDLVTHALLRSGDQSIPKEKSEGRLDGTGRTSKTRLSILASYLV